MKPTTTQQPFHGRNISNTTKPEQKKAIAPFAQFAASFDLVDVGAKTANRIFETNDFSKLQRYLEDAKSKDLTTSRNGLSAMYGVAHQFAAILEKVAEAGLVRFTGKPIPTGEEVTYAFRTDQVLFLSLFNQLMQTTARAIEARPGMKLGKAGAEEKPAEPIAVRIVEPQATRTVRVIERDEYHEAVRIVEEKTVIDQPSA